MTDAEPDHAAICTELILRAGIRDVPDYPEPGVMFKDITPLLADPAAFAAVVDALADRLAGRRVDKVVGHRGPRLHPRPRRSPRLGAGFVPVRKAGKLPGADAARSPTSWSTAPPRSRCTRTPSAAGDRVLVVDDVLATGGTAAATVRAGRAGRRRGRRLAVLIELAFLDGRDRSRRRPVHSLVTV